MSEQFNRLLIIDAWVNLVLGLLILSYPLGVDTLLGLPIASHYFYTSILGAVIFGIGLALLIEVKKGRGLGLLGAISINISGGMVLLYWLLFECLPGITTLGYVTLWVVCILVLGIGAIELVSRPWKVPGE